MKISNLKYISIAAILCVLSCNKPAELAPAKAEILKTETSAGLGAEISTTITANGGSTNISSAGAKVIVPAGAMPTGAAFTTQAIADKVDNEGQGISISGNWVKPITVEFTVPFGEKNPQNYKIALRLNNGYWITCTKPKYNTSSNTISVRIAPTSTAGAKQGAKIQAKKYDLAFAKTFYIKPEKSVIDIGEKVNLKAYAREGFVPVKVGNKTFDAEADLEVAIKDFVEASAKLDEDTSDDDLVPLTQPAKANAGDNDYLEPILIAREYEFTNNKTGFTRSWILMEGPGSVNKTGNAGAEYTAPNEEKAKGKMAEVSFLSKNDKTRNDLEAKAIIRIKDGLTRYEGTITMEILWKRNNETEVKNMEFKGLLVNSSFKNIFHEDPLQIATTITNYSFTNSKSVEAEILGSVTTNTKPSAASLLLLINENPANYRISGFIECEKVPIIGTYSNGEKYNDTRTIGASVGPEPVSNTAKYYDFGDGKTLTGSETITYQFTTTKTSWNLKKID